MPPFLSRRKKAGDDGSEWRRLNLTARVKGDSVEELSRPSFMRMVSVKGRP